MPKKTLHENGEQNKPFQNDAAKWKDSSKKWRSQVLDVVFKSSKVLGCHRWANIVPVDGPKDQKANNEAPWSIFWKREMQDIYCL